MIVKMDSDGCERRVKNAVTNIKGYIVMLALCVYVFVCVCFLYQLKFCFVPCIAILWHIYHASNRESKVYSSIIRKNIQQIAFKFCDNKDERNMIICDMQKKKMKAENNTPIMDLTYYLHKQHIKFLSHAKSNYLSF